MQKQSPESVTFSFIVPVYNEADGLENFYRRLTAVAEQIGDSFEIVFVNDGSEDDSEAILSRLAATDGRVRVVEFSRNFGHQAAVTAGYDHTRGRAVISLDSDCQHPPELIPEMVSRWREGFEVIYTVRQDTAGISPIRRAIGRLAYRLIRSASGMDLTDQADFRLLDRRAVEALRSTREQARFVRGLVRWIGFRQVAMPYVAEQRAAGQSSYTLKQLVGMMTAGIFNFSRLPLRLAPVLGSVLLAAAVLYAVVSLVLFPLGLAPAWQWHMVAAMAGLFGLQFLMLGLIGEYVGRIFEESKGRPLYVVRRKLGFEVPQAPPAEPLPPPPRQDEERLSVYT